MNHIFRLCVELLVNIADFFGTTYEIVNVWIFCILGPVFMLALTVGVIRYRNMYYELLNKTEKHG